MRTYQVLAVEPQLDGTDDLITPEDADNMRLPFNEGWDHWSVFQHGTEIVAFEDYDLAVLTCSALNSMVGVLEAA